ncbi:hypothetical protein AB0C31_52520 [Actinoplanes philippinensis]
MVADFIQWAKNNGIAVGPGRGSAAGSGRCRSATAAGSPRSRPGSSKPAPIRSCCWTCSSSGSPTGSNRPSGFRSWPRRTAAPSRPPAARRRRTR